MQLCTNETQQSKWEFSCRCAKKVIHAYIWLHVLAIELTHPVANAG